MSFDRDPLSPKVGNSYEIHSTWIRVLRFLISSMPAHHNCHWKQGQYTIQSWHSRNPHEFRPFRLCLDLEFTKGYVEDKRNEMGT